MPSASSWCGSAGPTAQRTGARNDRFYADYLAGRLDIDAYVDFATAPWRDRSAAELAAAMRSASWPRSCARRCTPAALALVQRHRDAGDLVAIVTATNDFVTRPIADAVRRRRR